MKKRTSIFLALCLCAVLISALGESLLPGDWYLSAVVAEGISLTPAGMGLDMKVTLYEDGSVLITRTKEANRKGVWVLQGDKFEVNAEGDRMIFRIQGETLTFLDEEKGLLMIFGREQAALPRGTHEDQAAGWVSPIRADAVMEDLEGEWVPAEVEVMGRLMEAEPLGFTRRISIRQGQVWLSAYGDDAETPAAEAAWEEGGLRVISGEGDEAEEILLRLHEDGRMSYVTEDQVTIYHEHENP